MSNVINMHGDDSERLIGLVHMAAKYLADFGDMPVGILKADGSLTHYDVVRFLVMEDGEGDKIFVFCERKK